MELSTLTLTLHAVSAASLMRCVAQIPPRMAAGRSGGDAISRVMSRFTLVSFVFIAACSSKTATQPPHSEKNIAKAEPSSCQPLPKPTDGMEVATDLDFDGDGVKDATVGPPESECGSEECPYDLFLKRGDCYTKVGSVDHVPTLLPTKHEGLFDVEIVARISGEAEQVTYRYDGSRYIAR